MKSGASLILAACAAFAAADIASAATASFTLSGGSDPATPTQAQFDVLQSGFTLGSGDLSMTVSARSYNYISAAGAGDGTVTVYSAFGVTDQKLGRLANGVGLFTSAGDSHLIESDVMDAFEYIRLSFNRPVTLANLGFAGFSGGDDNYAVIRDLNGDGVFGAGDNIGEDREVSDLAASGATDALRTWGVLSTGPFSEFLLSSVSVSYPTPAPVPLPAPALLLIGGLAALSRLRRRG